MNLFCLPARLPQNEWLDTLLQCGDIRIERIISTGQSSPPGFWYDQTEDEWVAVLQGNAALEWADGTVQELTTGDYQLIPAGKKHRVARTSAEPPCIWLAIFMSPA
jgi:cupin 2 domain-containing protein